MPPMCGGAPATKQPCLRQNERTRTHGRQTSGPGRHGFERLDECGVDRPSDQIVTASDHDRIGGLE
jgi:hypothetical protein